MTTKRKLLLIFLSAILMILLAWSAYSLILQIQNTRELKECGGYILEGFVVSEHNITVNEYGAYECHPDQQDNFSLVLRVVL